MAIKITTELVKELRDATSISVMQCRQALVEAEGDMQKALLILKKTSSDIATKKMNRATKDGRVEIKTGDKKAVLVALNCETDFVSKSEDFINLLQILTDKVITEGAEKTQQESKPMIDSVIQKTGENIVLGEVYEVEGDVLGTYVHNNKSGVIVSLSGGTTELARDIAMHVTAMKPEYITKEDISEDVKKSMQDIFQKEVSTIDKPENIKQKMLAGKINTYFKEKTLTEQPFIKNSDETVGKLLEKAGAKIKDIKRYSI